MDLPRTGMFSYSAAVKQIAGAQAGTPGRLNKIIGPYIAITKYTAGWTTAMKAANPVGYQHAEMQNKQATAAQLLGLMQDKVGGQMKHYSDTTAGAMSNAGHAIDNAGRQIGTMLLPVVQKLTLWLAKELIKAIQYTVKSFKQISTAISAVVTWFQNAITWVVNFYNKCTPLKTIVAAVGDALSKLGGILSGAFHGAVSVATGIFNGFLKVVNAVKDAINAVASVAKAAGGVLGSVFGGGGGKSYTHAVAGGRSSSTHLAHAHGRATGGYVSGAYGGGDTVPAMLAHGEYVLRAQAVQHVGVSRLNAMNQNATGASQGGNVIVLNNSIRLGSRVIAEEVTRFAARANALSGAYGPTS